MPTAKKTSTTSKKSTTSITGTKARGTRDTRVSRATSPLSVSVYSLTGKESGTMDLPKEVFGTKVNLPLLRQAIRVYTSNERSHNSNTKTRGEVAGSTAKMGAQKGGGRARHGAKRAPIYVGGGIALGPKSRKVELDLPQKMRRAALLSALSQRASENAVIGVAGLDKASGKTKELASFVKALNKKNILLVIDQKLEAAQRAVKNIPGLHMTLVNQLNAYDVVKHQTVIFTKDAALKLNSEGVK